MAQEIELKLGFPAEQRRALERHPVLAAVKVGRARHRELYSAYFDTPDEQLREAKAALRLRRDGGQWTQTMKTAGRVVGGMDVREELDWPVHRGVLDTEALASQPLFAAGGGRAIDTKRLRQAFVTRFLRTAFDVTLADGSVAEVAIDTGLIEAGRRSVPLSELEIELKGGEPIALIDLALALSADFPLRLIRASKAERGYALGRRNGNGPVRARAPELKRPQALRVAAERIVASCLEHLQAHEQGVLAGRDVEYLHQLRVGMRRLRAALSACAEAFDPAALAQLKLELAWLGEALGPARDWDVWCTETLPAVRESFPDTPGLTEIVRASQAVRRQAAVSARAALAAPRYTQLVLKLGRMLCTPVPRGAGRPLAAPHARKLLQRRLEKLTSVDLLTATPAERHRTRIAAKKLRYAAELFQSALVKPAARTPRRFIDTVASLQSVLGQANDVVVGQALLAELRARQSTLDPAACATIAGWLAGRGAGATERIAPTWRAVQALQPFW
ncbi:MAG: CHAD domain-containing protein [Burkholderiales bacterium]